MSIEDGSRARVRAWGWLRAASLALGCGSPGGSDDAGDSGSTNADDPASSSESGDEACGAGCLPGGTVMWEATWGSPGISDGALDVDVGATGRIAMTGYANWPGGNVMADGFVAVYEPDGHPVLRGPAPWSKICSCSTTVASPWPVT